MKIASKRGKSLGDYLDKYTYQPALTKKLDKLGSRPFDQDIINEIVLWKVNRYAPLSGEAMAALNEVRRIKPGKHRQSEQQLLTLLKQSGVDLPTASTLLRFRNRRAFQIIDRHAFRALRGYAYPLYPTSAADNKVRVFFEYLDDLHDLCNRFKLDFENMDRTLYVFDKRENGAL